MREYVLVEASHDENSWIEIMKINRIEETKGIFFSVPNEVLRKFKYWRQSRVKIEEIK